MRSPIRNWQKFSIFSGTNSLSECFVAAKSLLFVTNTEDRAAIVKTYEQEFARVAGCNFAWTFASGRMALYTALKALGVGPGDEVIVPAFSCVVVPNAIIYAGATPIYVDVSFADYNFLADEVEKKISSKTKVIYIQHTFGHLIDIEFYRKIASAKGAYLIEDCAHVLGVKNSQGRAVGSLGDLAIFSTDHSKVISTGYGGMLTANSPVLAEKIAVIYKTIPELPRFMTRKILFVFLLEYWVHSPYLYRFLRYFKSFCDRLGLLQLFREEHVMQKELLPYYPARLSADLAKIGLMQLRGLPDNLRARRERVDLVSEVLGLSLPAAPLLRASFIAKERSIFVDQLKYNFDLGIWFTSIMQGREDHWEEIQYQQGSCPNAEFLASHIVNFPTHQRIDKAVLRSELQRIESLDLVWKKN